MLDTRFDDCLEKVHAYVRAERFITPRLVPEAWKQAVGPNGDWRVCHGSQIDRICLGASARVDRNLQAILALGLLFERSGNAALRAIDICEFITLAPAIYTLRNLTDGARDWLRGKATGMKDKARFKKLIHEFCLPDNTPQAQARARLFLGDASDGCGMTWQNAKLIEAALCLRPDWTGVQVKILANRMEGRRPYKLPNEARMRCCQNEAEFVRLDQDKLRKLGSIREAASRPPVIGQKNDTLFTAAPSRRRRSTDSLEERNA